MCVCVYTCICKLTLTIYQFQDSVSEGHSPEQDAIPVIMGLKADEVTDRHKIALK